MEKIPNPFAPSSSSIHEGGTTTLSRGARDVRSATLQGLVPATCPLRRAWPAMRTPLVLGRRKRSVRSGRKKFRRCESLLLARTLTWGLWERTKCFLSERQIAVSRQGADYRLVSSWKDLGSTAKNYTRRGQGPATEPGHRTEPSHRGQEDKAWTQSPATEFRGAVSECGQLFFSKMEPQQ